VGLMDKSPNDAAVVRSVIELGRDLGITVVAEGVETEANLRTLRHLGCAVAQGYHIGYPVSAAEFEAMAYEWNTTGRGSEETVVTPIATRTALKARRVAP
jgi:EAL domain-containing protein (putative c-di-GMP-specific phosphodiesterase class I)